MCTALQRSNNRFSSPTDIHECDAQHDHNPHTHIIVRIKTKPFNDNYYEEKRIGKQTKKKDHEIQMKTTTTERNENKRLEKYTQSPVKWTPSACVCVRCESVCYAISASPH